VVCLLGGTEGGTEGLGGAFEKAGFWFHFFLYTNASIGVEVEGGGEE